LFFSSGIPFNRFQNRLPPSRSNPHRHLIHQHPADKLIQTEMAGQMLERAVLHHHHDNVLIWLNSGRIRRWWKDSSDPDASNQFAKPIFSPSPATGNPAAGPLAEI
jgi:hypothetical protein